MCLHRYFLPRHCAVPTGHWHAFANRVTHKMQVQDREERDNIGPADLRLLPARADELRRVRGPHYKNAGKTPKEHWFLSRQIKRSIRLAKGRGFQRIAEVHAVLQSVCAAQCEHDLAASIPDQEPCAKDAAAKVDIGKWEVSACDFNNITYAQLNY